MPTTRVETLPTTWDDARDLPFFRITDRLFPADFCFGASVLLASYDDTPGESDAAVTSDRHTVGTAAARAHTQTQPDRGPAPAQVRHPR